MRDDLFDVAAGQCGYVTSADAVSLGFTHAQLCKLATYQGSLMRLKRVGWGVFRFDAWPLTEYDQFMESVLLVGPGAFITGESVLALLNLASVNPRVIRVGTPRRVRRALPAWVKVVAGAVPAEDLTVYEGVPSVCVRRAIIDCKGFVTRDRLWDAVDTARREGYLYSRELCEVEMVLGPDPRPDMSFRH